MGLKPGGKALFTINRQSYLNLIMVVLPLMNFLSSLNIDIYAPSMPSIAADLNTSVMIIKNTITVTVLGWGFGAIIFGVLVDCIGRKKSLFYSVLCYSLASAAAIMCHHIHSLMLIRFVQGASVVCISIACRAILFDELSTERFQHAMVYMSIGYGLAPIIGPFFGGLLQHYFNWRANFIALFIFSLILLFILMGWINESLAQPKKIQFKPIIKEFFIILRNHTFLAGVFIISLQQMIMLLYPSIGPFIVQKELHFSALTFGYSALVVGFGYISGNILNRLLLASTTPKNACLVGYGILLISIVISYAFNAWWKLNLVTLIIPMLLINLSAGLIFSNLVGNNIQLFPKNPGMNLSIQVFLVAVAATMGLFSTSHLHIHSLLSIANILLAIGVLSYLTFNVIVKKSMD
jgi:MFS family permease